MGTACGTSADPEPPVWPGRPGGMVRTSVVIMLVVAAFLASGCAGAGAPGNSVATLSPRGASAPPTASDEPAGVDLSRVPTACIGLGVDDCHRVVAQVTTILPAGAAVTYIQVGPFGCAAGQGCAPSLVERPQGDITLEAGVGALSYHVTVSSDAELTIERQDAFGVLLGPQSQPPVTAGARPFSLGHCGLWSGIDVGGSWWDPIGMIDGDHQSAITSADGTLAILDLDRATFTADTGFTVQLVRRDGPKGFPGCM